MSETNAVVRSMHDLGLAAWFGGSLMGAVGLNGAAVSQGRTAEETARIAGAGWMRWAPVVASAVGAHLVGGAALLAANADRVRRQEGVASVSLVKTALTGAALAASAYTRSLGMDVARGALDPKHYGAGAADARRRLRVMQWVVPALTGGIVVVSALQGEQQRAEAQAHGMMRRRAKARTRRGKPGTAGTEGSARGERFGARHRHGDRNGAAAEWHADPIVARHYH
ncbi:hypothetical protein LO772_32615 [Yinghuangia sp. ASG 101]|uniref:hypothetical protein n=1 Tax=Yinghuangia sp. ASG 101 TaxID=2896848 RepID=UPI001E4BBE2E|nr:hypothetical protein [Yinghuangia sp. ASG 101]UGQ11476.1 hypothetical protein LO772_32615 [Yinghuangia sp. ASG 101]